MKIISILMDKNTPNILKNIRDDFYSDGYELRLDLIFKFTETKDISIIQKAINLIKTKDKIIVITLRDKNQGGEYLCSLNEKLDIYNQLASDNKNYKNLYFDFEYYIEQEIIEDFINKNHNSKIIYSYHNFTLTPEPSDLNKIFKSIYCQNITKTKIIYKIVTQARNSLESLDLISFLKNIKSEYKNLQIIAHCMGNYGIFSRVINGIYGSEFSYGILNQEKAVLDNNLGCISTEDLYNLYRIKKLNKNTKIYALLGNPVEHSVGHVFHNEYFSKLDINSIYIKINFLKTEVKGFFEKIKEFNFSGLSITMPLKEEVFEYISNKDDFKFIKAINTIKIDGNNLLGQNTDGVGAYIVLNELEQFDKNQINNFLFIGAGGAVEGIINELLVNLTKCNIVVLNRTLKNAEKIKSKFEKLCINKSSSIQINSFDDFSDINIKNQKLYVINAISNSYIKDNSLLKVVLDKIFSYISKDSVVMDINYYNDILDLVPNEIKAINGIKMFREQAKLQQSFWDN